MQTVDVDFLVQSELLLFHFNVAEHHLRLETFIETSNSAKKIIGGFNDQFFGGELEYEIVVVPPASGTFLSKLALWVTGGIGTLVAFLETDIGKSYIEGLTGMNPAEFSEQLGKRHR